MNLGSLDSSGAAVSDGGMLVAVGFGMAVVGTGVGVRAGAAQAEIRNSPLPTIAKMVFFIPNLLRK